MTETKYVVHGEYHTAEHVADSPYEPEAIATATECRRRGIHACTECHSRTHDPLSVTAVRDEHGFQYTTDVLNTGVSEDGSVNPLEDHA